MASGCVAEVMGTDLFTLTPDTAVGSALRLAAAKHVHHFLVIEEGSLTGIVTDLDLSQARQGAVVSACMRTPVLCIGPETTVEDAASIMEENAVGCLPVITGSFLVGLVTKAKLAGLTPPLADLTAVLEPEPTAAAEVCAACGKRRRAIPELRAGFLALCSECSGVIPRGAPRLGN